MWFCWGSLIMPRASSTCSWRGSPVPPRPSMARHPSPPRSDRVFLGNRQWPSERQEVIEVQILPQDDNWGDNTTAITGNTSDHSVSIEDVSKISKDLWVEKSTLFRCQMWTGTIVAALLSLCAFVSPIVMVTLPRIEALEWKVLECGPECDGLLISFAFKLLILLIGTWAVFFRRPTATLPRIFIYRSIVLALVFVFIISYWLFYAVRIAERRYHDELTYHSIVLFAVSLVDALLFIHYLAVILIEIRHLQPQYFVKVVRSPDGHSHCYNVGQLSIQRAAVWILERYYQDFPIYNPYLESLPSKSSRKSASQSNHISSPAALKYYDVDGVTNASTTNTNNTSIFGSPYALHLIPNLNNSRSLNTSRSFLSNNNINHHSHGNNINHNHSHGNEPRRRKGKDSSHHNHNERFYEEHDYERRVRKRRARLISACEEAFTHIQRMQSERGLFFIYLFHYNIKSFLICLME